MIQQFRGGGVLTVADSLRGVHVRQRIFRGGQGFAAFGRKFEGPPPPLDVFDTFTKQNLSLA